MNSLARHKRVNYKHEAACNKPLVAGSKGVEPLIEVLETSVIPFNYEPNIPYCIKLPAVLEC